MPLLNVEEAARASRRQVPIEAQIWTARPIDLPDADEPPHDRKRSPLDEGAVQPILLYRDDLTRHQPSEAERWSTRLTVALLLFAVCWFGGQVAFSLITGRI